jgi:hypothetical protein
MTNVPDLSQPERDRPVQVEGAPLEEGISEADVADRVDKAPADQENRKDPVQSPDASDDA